MLEAFAAGLDQVWSFNVLLAVLAGVPLGLVFGIIPGLGGLTALALLLPFVYGMEPMPGLAFLLATHAVVYTGGSVTTILLGIPGSPPNAATLIDGYAMNRRGAGGYALGAALMASGLGGLVGVVALVVLLPFLQVIVLSFGSPEIFFLALAGLTFVAVLGQGAMVKGLIAAGIGIVLAQIGYERITGIPRFWMNIDYLLDGVRLVPLALGLFAVPEILALAVGGDKQTSQPSARLARTEVWQGAATVIRRWRLMASSSFIGVVVGIIPGVGGDTAPFIAYGYAKQTTRDGEEWGTGAIGGVIAPESSNNAKEGGALVPTLALGIPGSAGMAILLGGFLVLGLEPGPDFLSLHMDLAVGMTVVLAVANVLAVVILMALVPSLTQIARLRPSLLVPVLLVLVILGAYAINNSSVDVAATFVFGALGVAMRVYGYSRPSLLLGFVLAPFVETYLFISLQAYGAWFFARPGTLILIAFVVASLVWPLMRKKRLKPIRKDENRDGG